MTNTDRAQSEAIPIPTLAQSDTGSGVGSDADGPAILLARPQLGENIGAAARAMANFGLTDLRIVAPRDGWPSPKAQAMAAGALGDHAADGTPRPGPVTARVFDDLPAAIADLRYMLAATARPRELEKPVFGPQEAVAGLRARRAAGAGVGVLFGPEASGLTNDEVGAADAIVTYPVNPAFASLNLAQAVGVFAHIWRASAAGDDAAPPFDHESLPAPKADFDGLMAQLEQALETARYFHPADKQPLMMRHMRAALTRAGLTEQEVRTLRGAIKALERGPRRQDRGG